jgi:hypothetical protein
MTQVGHSGTPTDAVISHRALSGIDALTESQRRLVWQALALSETADSRDLEKRETSDHTPSRFERAPGEPRPTNPLPQAKPVGTASVADLGQRRVDSVGCPHCDNRDVVGS